MSSRRIANVPVNTILAAYADGVALVNGTYLHCLQGAATTQVTNIWELSISGLASASSSPMYMLLSYDSTIGVGTQSYGTGSDVAMNPAFTVSGTAPTSGNVFVTSAPQRFSTGHLLNASLNAFGGVYFWRANRVEECPVMLGSAANFGSVSVSAFTGSTIGNLGSHLIYETI